MRILVLTRSYPAKADLYQYPFVHRRVVDYIKSGHETGVFKPTDCVEPSSYFYDNVECHRGNNDAFSHFVSGFAPDVIAAHGFSEATHELLSSIDYSIPTCAWLHGSEIPGFFRQKALSLENLERRSAELRAVDRRTDFWRTFLDTAPDQFKLVFVSQSAVELAREDLGERLNAANHTVIHNPIDTSLFKYHSKDPEARLRCLMVRPFDSRTYGNDMAVSAICKLATDSGFDRLEFTIVGDGPLFDETLKPIAGLRNVRIERRFLTQAEIAELHQQHGIFLVPTRLDTQGVSRDEAMSSGLVPVTNRVSAVPEFVDDSCAGLANPDDALGLAQAINEMAEHPKLFLARSENAAKRVRQQSGSDLIIPAELALLGDAANA